MITSKILADSVNPQGSRLTTYLLTYPRFIHSELMTHRAFSRNAASSRAIPFEKMVSGLGAVPEKWPAEKSGMQGGADLPEADAHECFLLWDDARDRAVGIATEIHCRGAHKSLANRLLEPFAYITVIVTAADRGLSNFFALRAHAAAQPEFQVLAFRMLRDYLASKARNIPWGAWHIPYSAPDRVYIGSQEANSAVIKNAVGRIARVSYNRHDDDDPAKNAELHDRLAAAGHWSPFEHVAQAWNTASVSNFDVGYGGTGCGWRQYRKGFTRENQTDADLAALLAAKPDWVTL